jgi:plastocyanin domain-containing protein
VVLSPDGQWRQARVDVRNHFVPDLIVGRAGEPLRILFRRQGGASSAEQVVFPALGRSATLPIAEDVPFEIVPAEPGEYEFTCQDGILRGSLLVLPR